MPADKLTLLAELLSTIAARGGIVHSKAREDSSLVSQAEQDMGLRFPPSLRDFFRTYEYLQIGGDELVDLGAIWELTSGIRELVRVPKRYLAFLEDGMGGYYFVACATKKQKADPDDFGQVRFWSHDVSGDLEYKSRDFLDFVIGLATKRLEFL